MASDPKKDEHVLRMVRQNLTNLQSLDCQEPEEPLPQDCCGQSCKPCVFDIHRKDLLNWARDIAKKIDYGSTTVYEHVYGKDNDGDIQRNSNFLEVYRPLEIVDIEEMTKDTKLVTFHTRGNCIDVPLGAHLRAR